jgi:hypothetical protein
MTHSQRRSVPVLTSFREDLLDPVVLDRAFLKLRARLAATGAKATDRPATLQSELQRIEVGLGRLTQALADGGDIPSLLEAIREREAQRRAVLTEMEVARAAPTAAQPDAETALRELRRRVRHWQFLLTEETSQARQMLRTLMKTRIVVTPNLEDHSAVFEARGNYDELFSGLINVPCPS